MFSRFVVELVLRKRTLGLIGVMFLAWLPLWSGLGSHPLYGRSESRYASVAQEMLRSSTLDAWLVPRFHGQPHLTKPPMQYWAMAASMVVFGETELAARLPSALASSLTVLLVGWLAWRLHGAGTAAACVALLSVMPAFVAVGRLGITDALLALCWIGTLGSGAMHARGHARSEKQTRWAVVMWAWVALGLLTKGPLVLLPAGLVLGWLAWARRWGALRAARPAVGLVLACVPLGLWVGALAWRMPEGWSGLWSVWRYEIVDRAAGSGDHPRPWWYLLPVFAVGLFPAVTQWPVPGVHVAGRRVREVFREGEAAALWALGLLSPLVLFTLFSGKLMTYVVPGAACGALLAGPVLVRWARGGPEGRGTGRLPVGGLGVMVLFAVLLGAAVVGVVRSAALPMIPAGAQWPVVVWAAGLVVCWGGCRWRRSWRVGALGLAWGLTAGLYVAATVVEAQVFSLDSTPRVLAALIEETGYETPAVRTVGYTDESLAFYTGRETSRVDPRFTVEEWAALDKRELVLLADPGKWEEFRVMNPHLVRSRYVKLGETAHLHAAADGGVERTVWVFVLRDAAGFNGGVE